MTFTDTGTAAWPPGVGDEDFVTVARQAFEDSHQRNANFNEIASAMGNIFSETDAKMRSLQKGVEGGLTLYSRGKGRRKRFNRLFLWCTC